MALDRIAPKAVGEELDYVFDWSGELGADTISSSGFIAADGLTVESDSNTDTTATVWLSGGTAGTVYKVVNTIITAAGRTLVKTVELRVKANR